MIQKFFFLLIVLIALNYNFLIINFSSEDEDILGSSFVNLSLLSNLTKLTIKHLKSDSDLSVISTDSQSITSFSINAIKESSSSYNYDDHYKINSKLFFEMTRSGRFHIWNL